MAGITFRGLLTEPQLQIIAMRTDQTHSALEFGDRLFGQFLQQRRLVDSRVDGARGGFGLDGRHPLR